MTPVIDSPDKLPTAVRENIAASNTPIDLSGKRLVMVGEGPNQIIVESVSETEIEAATTRA